MEWIIPGMIPRGFLACFFGRGGTGKSSLALAIALAVATARPVFGREVEAGRVLWVDGEQDASVTAARCRAVMAGWGIDGEIPAEFRYVPLRGLSLMNPTNAAELRRLVGVERPALVVVDSLRMVAMDGDCNESSDMQALMALLDGIASAERVGVLCIDHSAATDQAKPIGSTSKGDVMRSVLHVQRDGRSGLVKLQTIKANFSAPISLALRPNVTSEVIAFEVVAQAEGTGEGGRRSVAAADGVSRIRAVLEDGSADVQTIAGRTGVPVKTVRNRLYELRDAGEIRKSETGEWQLIEKPEERN